MKKRGIAHLSPLFLFFSLLIIPLAAETVRERANIHFAMSRWAIQAAAVPHAELPASKMTGGDEAFAVLTPSRGSSVDAIYPEAEGLGVIDYSGVPQGLLAFLDRITEGLREKTVDSALCAQDRAFLSTITEYKLERLSDIAQVLYSRPETFGANLNSVRYRLTVGSGKARKFVFLTVIVTGPDDAPILDDIIIDGPSYADAAQ